jgi:sodium-coupled neutral amino acid transporter 11
LRVHPFLTPHYFDQNYLAFYRLGICAYTVIVGDTIPDVLNSVLSLPSDSFWLSKQFIILVTTTFISLPLSLQRDMASLAKTSAVSMVR